MDSHFNNVPYLVQAIFLGDKSVLESPPNIDDINYKDAQSRTPLHAAAHVGDTDFVRFLLSNNARVNVKDIKWYTPLHRACASNAPSVVQILLDNGADRNMREKGWLAPLHVAAFNGSLECARLLLFYGTKDGECGTNINASDRRGHTPLHHAVYGGHVNMVRLLLTNGASVNSFDKSDRRAMHWAAACAMTSIIELLCEFGAEANCRDKLQYTPLHVAAALGHAKVVEKLIEHGADLNALTLKSNSALHIACLNGQRESVKTILRNIVGSQSGSSKAESEIAKALSDCNSDGYNPLHLSIITAGDAGCLEELIFFCKQFDEEKAAGPSSSSKAKVKKSSLDLETPGGCNAWTPLHLAAVYGRNRQAEMLLEMGANIRARDKHGNTSLHLAAARGHELVLNTLLDAGARWNWHGNAGATSLHCAAASGYIGCLNRLLEAAIDEWEADEDIVEELDEADSKYPTYAYPLETIKDDFGRNLVHAAALGGSIECLRRIILIGGQAFELDMFGRTSLHFALLAIPLARHFNADEPPVRIPGKCSSISEAVRFFLKLGIDPNIADVHGCTPLHLAAAYDTDGRLVNLLLRYGAKRYPVFARCPVPRLMSDSLTEHGSRLVSGDNSTSPSRKSSVNSSGIFASLSAPSLEQIPVKAVYYPLHLAAAMGNKAALEQLLKGMTLKEACHVILDSAKMTKYVPDEEKKEKGKEDYFGIAPSSWYFYSPLFLAAYRGNTECVEVLLDACKEQLDEEEEKEESDKVKPQDEKKSEEKKDESGSEKERDEEEETKEEGVPARDCVRHPPLSEHRPCGQLTDPLGRTPLHYAAHAGHLETCQLLVRHPLSRADPAFKDGVYQWNAVHHAAAQGHCPVLQFLIRWQLSRKDFSPDLINVPDEAGQTPLMLAAQNQRLTVLNFLTTFKTCPSKKMKMVRTLLLDCNIIHRVNLTDKMGRTALHRTAVNGQTEGMRMLLRAGASITASDMYGRQALHMAACSGKLHTLSYLCENLKCRFYVPYADEPKPRYLAPTDARGFTPLHLAVYRNQLNCVKFLTQFNAYQRPRGNTYTVFHCAVANKDVGCLRELLRNTNMTHLMTKDVRGCIPLHIAAMRNNADAIKLIIDSVTDTASINVEPYFNPLEILNVRDNQGYTPLMTAARSGATIAFDYLLNAQGNIEEDFKKVLSQTDSKGLSILHLSLCAPTEDTALYLLSRDESRDLIYRRTPDGRTALHLAAEAGFANVIAELIRLGVNVFNTDNFGRLPICGVAKTNELSKCLVSLLVEMMPNLKEVMEENPLINGPADPPLNPVPDSIPSSDVDFF